MAEFTPLPNWQHLQDTRAANEIVQAYNERRQCVDSSFDPVALLGAGSNAQDTAFWRGIQEWITQQVSRTSGDNRWLNYTVTIEGESAIPFMTLVDFKSLTGLNEGPDTGENATVGWRRATTWPNDWTDYTDPAYSYGPIQAGDIRGPWIFEDLQKGLDALRITAIEDYDETNNEERKGVVGSGFQSDLESAYNEAKDDAGTQWESSDWVEGGSALYMVMVPILAQFSDPQYDIGYQGQRFRADAEFSDIFDGIRCETMGYYLIDTAASGSNYFVDFDDMSSGNGNYAQVDTGELDNRESYTIGALDYESFPDAPFDEDINYVSNIFTFKAIKSDKAILVLKWEFSHTL